MRLTFEQFKKKIAETKAKIAQAFAPSDPKPGAKLSSTQKKRWRRARKHAPRAACDSFRYRYTHHLDRLRNPRRALRVLAARRAHNALTKVTHA